MRKLIVFLFVAIVSLVQAPKANAYWPGLYQINVFVNQYTAIARVQNTSYYPIVCSGYVYGYSSYGYTFNTYANQVWIAPGAHLDIYVNSNSVYDPMINARAELRCIN